MPTLNIGTSAYGYAHVISETLEYEKFWRYPPDDVRPPLGKDPASKTYERACLNWSLGSLPDTKIITVTKVELQVEVTSAGGASHLGKISPYNGDGQAYPCDDGAQTMYNRCKPLQYYLTDLTEFRTTGVKTFTLGDGENAQACIDITNAKTAVNRFSVGIIEIDDNDPEAIIYGLPLYTRLIITYEYRFNQGHFRWYKNGWQDQDAVITNVQNDDDLQFRVCIKELLGVARFNLDINVEFRQEGGNWQPLGAQGATDKPWRWRDDPTLTEHQTIDQARLSCTTENGKVHENACQNSESVAANAHHEICIVLEPYNAVQGKTYEFVVNVEGKRLSKDDEVATLVKCTMYSLPAVGYQYGDGLVSIQVGG